MRISMTKICPMPMCKASEIVSFEQGESAPLPKGWHRWTHDCPDHGKIEHLDACSKMCLASILSTTALGGILRGARRPRDPKSHTEGRQN